MSAEQTETWAAGDPYERYVGRWSRLVGRASLPFEPDGRITLIARAWAVRGAVPAA